MARRSWLEVATTGVKPTARPLPMLSVAAQNPLAGQNGLAALLEQQRSQDCGNDVRNHSLEHSDE